MPMTRRPVMADEIRTRQRVAAGVALLDQQWPQWRELVDRRLDMADGGHDPSDGRCGCVVSQYHAWGTGSDEGDFYYGIRWLHNAVNGFPSVGVVEWAVDHGFVAEAEEYTAAGDEEYALLTRLWWEELAKEPARG